MPWMNGPVLGMDFPNTAAEGGDADEAGIRRHVDVVHFHEGQARAEAAPVGAAICSPVNSKERGRKHGVLIDRTDDDPGNRNVGQACADIGKGQATIR